MDKDTLITMLKRVIVQISIITVSIASFLILFLAPIKIDIELKNQFLSISTGILTGALLSLIYVLAEQKINANLTNLAEERLEKQFDKISDEIKASNEVIINSMGHNKDCAYCTQAIRCFSNRDKIMLGDKFFYAKKRIYIFTTNLLYLTDSMTNIEQAVKNNVDIKILVLKPTSMFVKIRYKELGFESPKDFFDELNISIKNALKKKKDFLSINPKSKFEVRTHLHTPTFMLYLIDDELYFNPIVPLYRGRDSVHIYYNLSDSHARNMAKDYINTFETCWNTAFKVEDNYVFDINKLESLDDYT